MLDLTLVEILQELRKRVVCMCIDPALKSHQ